MPRRFGWPRCKALRPLLAGCRTRVRSTGTPFLADPRRWLRRAADHLGVPMTEDNLESVVGGPLFAAYSKNPRVPFNNAMRLARRSEFARKLAPELERAQHWIWKKSDAGLIQKIAVATL